MKAVMQCRIVAQLNIKCPCHEVGHDCGASHHHRPSESHQLSNFQGAGHGVCGGDVRWDADQSVSREVLRGRSYASQ